MKSAANKEDNVSRLTRKYRAALQHYLKANTRYAGAAGIIESSIQITIV